MRDHTVAGPFVCVCAVGGYYRQCGELFVSMDGGKGQRDMVRQADRSGWSMAMRGAGRTYFCRHRRSTSRIVWAPNSASTHHIVLGTNI